MTAEQKQELITEIKIVQAEIEILSRISREFQMPVLLQDIDERNKIISLLRDKYFSLID